MKSNYRGMAFRICVWACAGMLFVTIAAAIPPSQTGWRIQRHTDKMTGKTTTSMVIDRTADDGSPVEATAGCAVLGDVKGVTLSVLFTGARARLQIDDQTSTSGNDLFGYSSTTRHRTAARIKFDDDDPISVYPDVDYADQFTLLFSQTANNRFADPDGARSHDQSAESGFGTMMGDLAAMMITAADVDRLKNSSKLAIQANLEGGGEPYLEIPIDNSLKQFTRHCLGEQDQVAPSPVDTPKAPVALSENVVSGEYDSPNGDQRLIFANGTIRNFFKGREVVNLHYTIDNDTITLIFANSRRLTLILNAQGELIPTDPAYHGAVVARRVGR